MQTHTPARIYLSRRETNRIRDDQSEHNSETYSRLIKRDAENDRARGKEEEFRASTLPVRSEAREQAKFKCKTNTDKRGWIKSKKFIVWKG